MRVNTGRNFFAAAAVVLGLAAGTAPEAALAQSAEGGAKSKLTGIVLPYQGRPGGRTGEQEARQALEQSVEDRKQGEKITGTESVVWKDKERPNNARIRETVVSALKKKGYSYEVLYDGTSPGSEGQGVVYFEARPGDGEGSVVGMWLGFSEDEFKLVWATLAGGQTKASADAGDEEKDTSGEKSENAELVEALHKKGLKALADDRSDDARKAFQQVLELDPNHKGARKALSTLDPATSAEKPAADKTAEKPAAPAETPKPAQEDSAAAAKEKAAADALRRLLGR